MPKNSLRAWRRRRDILRSITRPMKPKRIILIVAAMAVIVASATAVIIAVDLSMPAREWVSVTVPLDAESSLIVSLKHSHPFLAEYRREVTVIRSGERLEALDYPKDTGGGFP